MLTQSPFDILAETYDADFTQSRIGQLQRERVWSVLTPVLQRFNRRLRILEINCGTGEDALALGSMGHQVTATDASATMIKKSKQKAERSANPGGVRFIQCSFSQLPVHFAGQQFDLVFSNFGGLNCICEKEILQLSLGLSTIVAPGGQLFLVVMSRSCLWEMVYYTAKGKFSTAFRRRKKNVLFEVEGLRMPVAYYSPGRLKKLFHPYFTCQQSRPAGLFIPPAYLENYFSARGHWLNRLNHWEERFGKFQALSSLADHFCITFKTEKIIDR